MACWEGWVEGYKVECGNWYDKEHIYLGGEYYKPGSSLGNPPAREFFVLIPNEDVPFLRNVFESVVVACMQKFGRPGGSKPDGNTTVVHIWQ